MYSSGSVAVVIVSVILPVLAAVALALRLRARRLKSLSLQADDYLVILALAVAAIGSVLYIVGAANGGIGAHGEDLDEDTLARLGKIAFAMELIYPICMGFIKLSVVFFYKRIFTTRNFIVIAWTAIGIVTSWTIASVFVRLFSARPISWNWTGVGIQNDLLGVYIGVATTDIVTDVFVLCLPLPMIKKLHMSTKRKWSLSGIFWIGGLSIIAGCVRLYYLTSSYQTVDVASFESNPLRATAFPSTNIIIWTSIEPCTSIIAACLPLLGPVFQNFSSSKRLSDIRSLLVPSTKKSTVNDEKKCSSPDSSGSTKSFRKISGSFFRETSHSGVIEMDDLEKCSGILVSTEVTTFETYVPQGLQNGLLQL